MNFIANNSFFNINNDGKLFSEFTLLNEYITDKKISEWNTAKETTESRWVEIFKHFKNNNLEHQNILRIAEYMLCLPGTNASIERMFSLINKIWVAEKTQVVVRNNVEMDCLQFFNFLKNRPDLLKEILSSEKYI